MKIRYFATIRELTREQELEWRLPAATLDDLLHALSVRYGSKFAAKMYDSAGTGLHAEIIILINGRDSRHLAELDTPLHPEDTVSIFPMVAGG